MALGIGSNDMGPPIDRSYESLYISPKVETQTQDSTPINNGDVGHFMSTVGKVTL